MSTVTSATLGLVFFGLAVCATLLMYYLWGFPFDKATRTSAAPKSLMRLHRAIGYSYTILYVAMMAQMAPRMWQYQVEFPPRTVAHMVLGMLIGVILVLKIVIMRFFRHLEEWMPYLGTALFAATVLLIGVSAPFALREQALSGSIFGAANRSRVAQRLTQAQFPAGASLADLSSIAGLRAGREVLQQKCVRCHDLKTVLERPHAPAEWVAIVQRMAAKPAVFSQITVREQGRVAAYLIAITPDESPSASPERENEAARAPAASFGAPSGTTAARATFDRVCAQCHATSRVDTAPPRSAAEVPALLRRMTDHGMRASADDLRSIQGYLNQTYVTAPAAAHRRKP
ncbi:MAG TPA: hypothetical protein VKT77_16675 [Chthonomonadaceae bacterium]|nr:hypothetical protein [Chthonomonadaceae bacterium]